MLTTNNSNEDGQMLKQYVWGAASGGYIDELVQVGYNQDPQNADSHHQYYDSMENECEYYFYPMQDANFNIMGIVNQDGRLVERYEYTPYANAPSTPTASWQVMWMVMGSWGSPT